jgi:exodeoxyribonuclease VII small subunit
MTKRKSEEIPLDFESSIAELEKIVSDLETESLTLENMISSFERGNSLLKSCEQILKSARQRLVKISSPEDSLENALAFDSNMHNDTPTATPPTEHDDSISLF